MSPLKEHQMGESPTKMQKWEACAQRRGANNRMSEPKQKEKVREVFSKSSNKDVIQLYFIKGIVLRKRKIS